MRKAVNWALRNIGKRNERLLPAAVECAKRLREQDSKAARWIAADALREFRAKWVCDIEVEVRQLGEPPSSPQSGH